jgi:hypothetical protein
MLGMPFVSLLELADFRQFAAIPSGFGRPMLQASPGAEVAWADISAKPRPASRLWIVAEEALSPHNRT